MLQSLETRFSHDAFSIFSNSGLDLDTWTWLTPKSIPTCVFIFILIYSDTHLPKSSNYLLLCDFPFARLHTNNLLVALFGLNIFYSWQNMTKDLTEQKIYV